MGLDYFIPEDTKLSAEFNNLIQQPYLAIAIGAQHYTKRLPTAKLIEICKTIPTKIILLGGKEDEITGQQIADKCGTHVVNLAGKLSLNQSALVIKQAQQVITHDTGLMHITEIKIFQIIFLRY